MRALAAVCLIPLCLFVGTGCVVSPVTGLFYTDAGWGDHTTSLSVVRKAGEGCAQSWLGLVAVGDAGIEAAKANGSISRVAVVDHTAKNMFGIWTEFCTIVRGE